MHSFVLLSFDFMSLDPLGNGYRVIGVCVRHGIFCDTCLLCAFSFGFLKEQVYLGNHLLILDFLNGLKMFKCLS